VTDFAARAIKERHEADQRNAFLDSPQGVESAQREFDSLFAEVQRVCAQSRGLIIKPERKNDVVSMAVPGEQRMMTFVFQLQYRNTLNDSELRVVEFDSSYADARYNPAQSADTGEQWHDWRGLQGLTSTLSWPSSVRCSPSGSPSIRWHLA
jgi:hypothetical protein